MKNFIIAAKKRLQKFLQAFLPHRFYNWLWQFWAGAVVCRKLLCDTGYLRSCRTGGSVDRNGEFLPWYTYPAIEFVKRLPLHNKDVLEYGGGFGTIYYSRRARSVSVVEHDPEWTRQIVNIAGYRTAAFVEHDRARYVNAPAGKYDIIVIDGEWRMDCAKAAISKLRKGGMIILDNSDVNPDAAMYLARKGLLRVDFVGFAPYINYISSTSVFFDARK